MSSLACSSSVAAGAHDHVDVVVAHQFGQVTGVVHSCADRGDDALLAKLDESGYPFVNRLHPVELGVVQQGDVDGAVDAITAEVPLPMRFGGEGRVGHEEPADLGGQDIGVAWPAS
jgi:hypothetical protein